MNSCSRHFLVVSFINEVEYVVQVWSENFASLCFADNAKIVDRDHHDMITRAVRKWAEGGLVNRLPWKKSKRPYNLGTSVKPLALILSPPITCNFHNLIQN